MTDWMMMTLIGADRPGIVARVARVLSDAGVSLGEASMLRLGGSFTIMMMVSAPLGEAGLRQAMTPVLDQLGLRMHLDPVDGGLHRHQIPNVRVRVNGADRTGIVADVTGALLDQGFNILELDSDVAGDSDNPLYIMTIEGYSERPLETLTRAVEGLGVNASVSPIETLIG